VKTTLDYLHILVRRRGGIDALTETKRESINWRVAVGCWNLRSAGIRKAHIERRPENGTRRARIGVAQLRLAIATKGAQARGSVIAENLVTVTVPTKQQHILKHESLQLRSRPKDSPICIIWLKERFAFYHLVNLLDPGTRPTCSPCILEFIHDYIITRVVSCLQKIKMNRFSPRVLTHVKSDMTRSRFQK
jgi:hypothetical protein